MKKFWKNKKRELISLKKLKEVILDIEAIREGNYDLID